MDKIVPVKAFKDNYIWLLINTHNKTAACVDPGQASPVLKALASMKLQLVAILVTHHHYDHSGGIAELSAHGVKNIYGSAHEKLEGISEKVQEGDSVNIESLNYQFSVLDIPAHTAGHIAFYDNKNLFCGDTLFTGGCGRLFEGSAEQMYQSLQKMCNLPDHTLIYCGHEYTEKNLQFATTVEGENKQLKERLEYIRKLRANDEPTVPSTLGLEKATNPFLRCKEASVRQAAEEYSKQTLDSPIEVFRVLRQWKDNF